jgi:hypothetical protein
MTAPELMRPLPVGMVSLDSGRSLICESSVPRLFDCVVNDMARSPVVLRLAAHFPI